MDDREPNLRGQLWLTWLFLLVQSALLFFIAGRVTRAPAPQEPRPQPGPLTAPALVAQEPPPVVDSPPAVEPERQPNSLLSFGDIIGLTSVAVTIAGAAIFYIAGWFYEANWYSYYGLNISGLELAPFEVMVNGTPGILLIFLSIPPAFITLHLLRERVLIDEANQAFFSPQDVRQVSIMTYIIAYIAVYGFSIALYGNLFGRGDLPIEGTISLVIGSLLVSYLLYTSILYSALARLERGKLTVLQRLSLHIYAWKILFWPDLRAGRIRQLSHLSPMISEVFQKVEEIQTEKVEQRKSRLRADLASLPDFGHSGILFVMTLFLLLSITVSAFLAEFDARRAARSLSGNWQISEVTVFANAPIEALQSHEKERTMTAFVYGPLGQLGSTESSFILVEQKEGTYYENPPLVYFVPHDLVKSIRLTPPEPPDTSIKIWRICIPLAGAICERGYLYLEPLDYK